MGAAGAARARALVAVVVAVALPAAWPGEAQAASGGKRQAAARHEAGKTPCAKGAAGRRCRQRRRALRRSLRPAADLAAPGPVDAAQCADADVLADVSTLDPVAVATLCLVNVARHRAGRHALRANTRLGAAARGHAEDMVARGFFSHQAPGRPSGFERAGAAGYAAARYGEVIAAGDAPAATARGIVDAWLDSPAHRAALLSPLYRDAGVAVAAGTPAGTPGATWVMDLGDR